MQIIINLNNAFNFTNIKIDDENNTFLLNGHPKDLDVRDFVRRLQVIIADWQPMMVNNSVVDGSWYEVKMKVGDATRRYGGKNSFPLNYEEFLQLIREVNECY